MQVHEPLTLLQKSCEMFLFSELLSVAARCDDASLRLAYVTAFLCSFYCVTENCRTLPFMPFIGETFEFCDASRNNLRFFAEQVEENRLAIKCFNEDFEFSSTISLEMRFWGTKLEVFPQGPTELRLVRRNEVFSLERPATCAENLLVSSFFVDNYGEFRVKNLGNALSCDLEFKRRGFDGRNACEIEGAIGASRICGNWSEKLVFLREKEEVLLWSNSVREERAKNPYNFTDFAMKLNRLDQNNVFGTDCRDSRFRSDVKALEYGLVEVAKEEHEKLRGIHKEKLKSFDCSTLRLFEKRGSEYFFKGL